MTWTMNYRYNPEMMEPEEIEPVYTCSMCHEGIYQNEPYFEWNDCCYCESCFHYEADTILLNNGARQLRAEAEDLY